MMSVEEMISRLREMYPCGYFHVNRDPYYMLISTVLSQRTRDEVTIPATRRLFEAFDSPLKMASAEIDEIQVLIKDVGFYRVKAQRIIDISRIMLKDYGGIVPDSMNELLKLPGVGRKTANCVLGYAFEKDVIAVDTHVHRISNRFGLVKTSSPDETEKELEKVVSRQDWKDINGLMVLFGQNVCRPMSPRCGECRLNDICPRIL
ncbi:endonuclease III / DNA-(apurinic or apyrimidinic site) lyase [Methanolobus psychrophilus R15]|nr:endonuclease III / DNA-(apurinic or apyrimidinic site) lyase [Methanolobus psychrophilus R15]